MRQRRRQKCVSTNATLPGYSASARSTGHFPPPAARTARVCRYPRRLIERSWPRNPGNRGNVGQMPTDPSLSGSIRGLIEADAQARLKAEGYNELPRPERRTPLRIIVEVVREPMLALLLGGGVVYLALGDLKEALILLVFATLSDLDHRSTGDPHRAGSGGAARSHQPPCAGHSRWRTQTDRRPRGRAWRSCRACRGRSGTG